MCKRCERVWVSRWILLNIFQYCTYCTYCTSSYKLYILPILYKIARYCTKLLNIACGYTNCYKLYTLPILFKLLKIVQYIPVFLCPSWEILAAAALLLAASMLAASMLPIPLTVLLLYEFAATIHLLSTTAPCAPQQRGQQRLHEPVN